MAAGIGRAIQRGALFLRCDNLFDCRGDRNGFCGNQSGEGAFLHCCHQRRARAIFAYRHPSRRLQPAADAKSAKLDAVTRRRRTNAVAMFGAAIAMFVL